jgi:hypothetical protein
MSSEPGFRAQLLIPEQRQLFDYWRSCRGARPMPAREDIAPGDIPGLLPGLGLIDVEGGFGRSFVRLAGSALRDLYGLELTGKYLGEISWGERAGYWCGVYSRLVESRTPMHGVVRGPIADRDHVTMFWLRLPLSDNGERVNKVLCYDTALAVSAGLSRPRFRSASRACCA